MEVPKSSGGLGNPICEIYQNIPNNSEIVYGEVMKRNKYHTVLFQLPLKKNNSLPIPYDNRPTKGTKKKDIPLPTDILKKQNSNGEIKIENLWPIIKKSLSYKIKSISDLEKVISKYNSQIKRFKSLRSLCKQINDSTYFFKIIIPGIIQLALRLPILIKTGIPYLRQDQNHSLSLSQEQVACLLANAFLCTFPNRYCDRNYSSINFNTLFESEGDQVIEKLKCIINYFQRIISELPTGILTFTRRSLIQNELPDWSQLDIPISKLKMHITCDDKIEYQAAATNGSLFQVDFANKYIGGDVLKHGCNMEQILFMTYPELIISRLFTEFLKDNEALIVTGVEKFNIPKGYGVLFKFDKNYYDITTLDKYNRRQCNIILIDALLYENSSNQYSENNIKRELNKAYIGFYNQLNMLPIGIVTGNWGCGAYNGDPKLKSLIQLMVCTVTNRPLLYCTYGNKVLMKDLHNIYKFFIIKNINIKKLWEYINEYRNRNDIKENLYTFIQRIHNENEQNSIELISEKLINKDEIREAASTSQFIAESITEENVSEFFSFGQCIEKQLDRLPRLYSYELQAEIQQLISKKKLDLL